MRRKKHDSHLESEELEIKIKLLESTNSLLEFRVKLVCLCLTKYSNKALDME